MSFDEENFDELLNFVKFVKIFPCQKFNLYSDNNNHLAFQQHYLLGPVYCKQKFTLYGNTSCLDLYFFNKTLYTLFYYWLWISFELLMVVV